MFSSEQVIPGISPPLLSSSRPYRSPLVFLSSLLSPLFPGASEQQQQGTLSPPLGADGATPSPSPSPLSREQQFSGAKGCRTDCFLFRASVSRPLFPRVAVLWGNDKQMSTVVHNGHRPPPRRHGDATWRSTFLTRRCRRICRPLGVHDRRTMCDKRGTIRREESLLSRWVKS